jgi:hypothetical protein
MPYRRLLPTSHNRPTSEILHGQWTFSGGSSKTGAIGAGRCFSHDSTFFGVGDAAVISSGIKVWSTPAWMPPRPCLSKTAEALLARQGR